MSEILKVENDQVQKVERDFKNRHRKFLSPKKFVDGLSAEGHAGEKLARRVTPRGKNLPGVWHHGAKTCPAGRCHGAKKTCSKIPVQKVSEILKIKTPKSKKLSEVLEIDLENSKSKESERDFAPVVKIF